MSHFNCTAWLVTVGLRSGVDFREIDQLMARADWIQATQEHQRADRGFTFAERKQLSPEIRKSVLGLPHVSCGLIILAYLTGTDRQLSRSRQPHVAEGKHPLEGPVPKPQNRL